MSSQGFSFPPPPPPPPTTQQPAYPTAQHGWSGRGAGGRGRGRGHGNRGRGGGHYHSDSGRPPYSNPPSYNYTPGNYGYPAPPASATSYIPPPPYPHAQSNFQHPQNTPTYQSPQLFSQPAGSAPFQPLPGYNNLSNLPHSASYSAPATPTYHTGVSTHQHASPTGAPMMMGSAPWGAEIQPAPGSFGGAASSHGRGSWSSHPHGNHGSKPRHNNKRDHTAAFSKPQSTAPRTPAPPAVPSFGNPLPSKPPPAADATRKPKKRKRKQNQLGLTPKTEEHESSEEEEDVDEESKLAQAGPGSTKLQFTYKGQTATLQSASDIAAWIAERRKKFPTAARIEEKKKAADEAKAAREAARQEKEKAKPKPKPKEPEPKAAERSTDPALDAAMKAQRKADKIRRNLDREQKRFARAEAAAEAARLKVEALKRQAEGLGGDQPQQNGIGTTDSQDTPSDSAVKVESASQHTEDTPIKLEATPDESFFSSMAVDGAANHLNEAMDLSSEASDNSDWTSSSGSDSGSDSDSDDDSAPEEVSSRRQGPERVAPPPREGKKQLCRHFARSGQCNRGDKCKFSHEVSERGPKNKPQAEKKGRKGLFQALLEKQKEEEDRRAMEAICWLGQHGMLEQTNSSIPNGAPRSDTPA